MTKNVGVAFLKIEAVVICLVLAVVYMKLGYFLVFVWVLGVLVAVALTLPQWKAARWRSVGVILVVVGYFGLTWLTWNTFLGRETAISFNMLWESRGATNQYGEAEVVLRFVDFPGNYVGEYSDDLFEYLSHRQANPVEASFAVTRDLGWCFRSFRLERVGNLTSWESAWEYAGRRDGGPSPWDEPWWCP
jgi:hypothetical protein